MKNFGCLQGINLEELDYKDLVDLMLKKGFFELKNIAEGNSQNIINGTLTLTYDPNEIVAEPSKELVDEFYSFLTKEVFKYYILEHKLEFFNKFNTEIFGLDFSEQKKIALQYFNTIYNENYIETIQQFNQSVSENGISHTYNCGKLEMLFNQLSGFKYNLFILIKVNNYLEGNRSFFTPENLLANFDIIKELQFEISVQILVELNDRFYFEEDISFTKIKEDKIKFEKYKHIFETLESYQFTNTKIKSFKEDEKAKSVSLYQVLIDKNLIIENKDGFKRFMKSEYGFFPAEIITYEKDINRTHDKRVIQFTADWEKFEVKK